MWPSSIPSEKYSRIKTDSDQAAFWIGTQFRAFKEITLASGASLYLKMERPCNIVIRGFSMSVNAGEMRCEIYRNASLSGTWNSSLLVIPKRELSGSELPSYSAQCSISSGGAFSGGTLYDLMHVKTSGNSQQGSTVGGEMNNQLAAPGGSVGCYKFTNPGNSSATAIFSLWWEELP